ncbi:hypothetical protein GQ43DRAFT_76670 [Delitschia confertaspora ATCC 74209]|uniref:Uncharacterized protein n=1 Tax=Delitschia confertaspora ATCC 74209 TaxID=1513339 RepID=A0A9P4MXZ3_9PLEO|nr:hypothetical protein GQ43DRAFT_76670 [Delitschia confertaspora ATCC 74209]
MTSEETYIERPISYGRGGAGNLRRPSAVIQAREMLKNMHSNEEDAPSTHLRRSSIRTLHSSHSTSSTSPLDHTPPSMKATTSSTSGITKRTSIWKTPTCLLKRRSVVEEDEGSEVE